MQQSRKRESKKDFSIARNEAMREVKDMVGDVDGGFVEDFASSLVPEVTEYDMLEPQTW